jgi:hypothetical protein
MFKAIYGVLAVLIALAIVSSLTKTQLGALWQTGQTTTRAHSSTGSNSATTNNSVGSMAGRAVGGARLDGFAATAGAEIPSAQPQTSGAQQSMFGRTDDAWRKSEERYKRADP